MKKCIYLFATIAFVAFGCSKEQDVIEKVEKPATPAGRVTLTATMPQFIDDATKASIDEDGLFSWELGDKIYVKYVKEGADDAWITFICNNINDGTFESSDSIEEGYSISTTDEYVARYEGLPGYTYGDWPYNIAPTQFRMQAKLVNGRLIFEHQDAMMKVTVKNVPSFARIIIVGNSKIHLPNFTSTQESISYYVPVAPASEAKLGISVKDGADNQIVDKNSKNAKEIEAGHLYELPNLTIGPVLDVTKYATSWTKVNTYIVGIDGDSYMSDLSGHPQKMFEYENGKYFRILPETAINNTYRIVYYNSTDASYRVVTSLTVANQNAVSVSQKEGVREFGNTHHRLILHDEALGTTLDNNPDTYLYIKGVEGVTGSDGLTGGWRSNETKALGWFTTKRDNVLSGRYYYFDTNALANYTGLDFWFSYLMYEEGTDNVWRYADNYKSPVKYFNYTHLGFYYHGSDLTVYNDNGFDSQVNE